MSSNSREDSHALLPTVASSRDGSGVRRVSGETVAKLISGAYRDIFAKWIVIDSRYYFEYQGGHIKGAVNLNKREEISQLYLQNKAFVEQKERETGVKMPVCFIFHCEYSQKRGPQSCNWFRELDRQHNHYPALTFPASYIMEGGYSRFIEKYHQLCVNPSEEARWACAGICANDLTRDEILNGMYCPMDRKDMTTQLAECQKMYKQSWQVNKKRGRAHSVRLFGASSPAMAREIRMRQRSVCDRNMSSMPHGFHVNLTPSGALDTPCPSAPPASCSAHTPSAFLSPAMSHDSSSIVPGSSARRYLEKRGGRMQRSKGSAFRVPVQNHEMTPSQPDMPSSDTAHSNGHINGETDHVSPDEVLKTEDVPLKLSRRRSFQTSDTIRDPSPLVALEPEDTACAPTSSLVPPLSVIVASDATPHVRQNSTAITPTSAIRKMKLHAKDTVAAFTFVGQSSTPKPIAARPPRLRQLKSDRLFCGSPTATPKSTVHSVSSPGARESPFAANVPARTSSTGPKLSRQFSSDKSRPRRVPMHSRSVSMHTRSLSRCKSSGFQYRSPSAGTQPSSAHVSGGFRASTVSTDRKQSDSFMSDDSSASHIPAFSLNGVNETVADFGMEPVDKKFDFSLGEDSEPAPIATCDSLAGTVSDAGGESGPTDFASAFGNVSGNTNMNSDGGNSTGGNVLSAQGAFKPVRGVLSKGNSRWNSGFGSNGSNSEGGSNGLFVYKCAQGEIGSKRRMCTRMSDMTDMSEEPESPHRGDFLPRSKIVSHFQTKTRSYGENIKK